MIVRLKRAIGVCLVVTLLVPGVAAHAATYYVSTTGDNSNPGTENKPWRTVTYAVTAMLAGDTTYVRGGTYSTEGNIRFNRTGTATAPIKLLNYPGESPVIDFVDKLVGHTVTVYNSLGASVAMGYITVEGFEIKNGHDGIKFYNMHNSVIRRNWIHDNNNQGILGIGGHHNLFEQNVINHNGNFAGCSSGELHEATNTTLCNKHHGMYLHGQFYTITNNLIYDNLAIGIQQNGSSTSIYQTTKHPGPEFSGATDWIIANNTFAYNNFGPAITIWGSLTNNTRIENNIFYRNKRENVSVASSAQGVGFSGVPTRLSIQIRNNHSYGTSRGAILLVSGFAVEGLHYTQSENLVTGSSPAFVNAPATLPASPNFALTARSPAIDAGLPLALVKTDFKGTPRPQGRAPDIGAYEYTAGGDSQSPAAPNLLRAD